MYSKAYCYNQNCGYDDYKLASKNQIPKCPECNKEMLPVAEVNHKI